MILHHSVLVRSDRCQIVVMGKRGFASSAARHVLREAI